jgi:hypothetical protein
MLCSCDKMRSHIRLYTHMFGVNSDMHHSTGAVNMKLLHSHEKSYLGNKVAQ